MITFPRGTLLGVVCATAWLLAVCIAPPAHARTIYVREAGDDANNGLSPAQALRTIRQGAELAVAGDTVLVGPGTYFEGDIMPGRQLVRFVADRRGTGVGEPPGDVVIDATGFSAGFEVNGKAAVTIDGFGISSATGPGIYVKSGSPIAVISNNIVSRNGDNGIYVQDSRDAIIFNNLVYNNRDNGILIATTTDGSSGARLLNNTVYQNMNRGVYFNDRLNHGSPNGLVLNNIVAKNGVGILVSPVSQPGFFSAGNVFFENNFSASLADVTDQDIDPLFIDPDGADNGLGGNNYADDNFRLQQQRAGQALTSPAVDAGSDLSRRLNLSRASTRSDGKADRGFVDAGYHYNNFSSPPPNPTERVRPKKLYVSQANGNDANNGETRETAVATLTRAFVLAKAGHMISVIGGTFTEANLRPPSGRLRRPVTIKASNGATISGPAGVSGLLFGGVHYVVVDGMRVSGADSGVDISNTSIADDAGGANIVLRRCRLSGNTRGLSVKDSNGIQVVATVIENNNQRGIQLEDSDITVDRSTIRGNGGIGLWAFDGSTAALTKTDLIDNTSDGILAERDSVVSMVGGKISGSVEGGARFRFGSTGTLEDVEVFDNDDVGLQAVSSTITVSGGSISESQVGVQSFVDSQSRQPVVVGIYGTRVCANRIGIDARATALISVDADVCANRNVGIRLRGGSLDLSGGKVRLNEADGISAVDADRLVVRKAVVSENFDNGIQAIRIGEIDVEDSRVHANDGGLTVFDSVAPTIVNNLIHDNSVTGVLLAGNSIGSPDARVMHNTFFRNGDRGLFIDDHPESSGGVVIGNIFNANRIGIQVNVFSQVNFVGDYNLNTDGYGGDLEEGPHDVIADPVFVAPDLGDFHLSQTGAGQSATSPAVNAGNASAAASGMAMKTTRTDKVADTGIVDLGYHYLP